MWVDGRVYVCCVRKTGPKFVFLVVLGVHKALFLREQGGRTGGRGAKNRMQNVFF